jgi:hypothetical protein
MNTPTKLAAYALGLVAAFGGAVAVGDAVVPLGVEAHGDTHAESGHGISADRTADDDMPGGLMISEQGYTLALSSDTMSAGAETPVAFQVLGPDGQPVTDYERAHDRDLHFIVVRRDMTGFQHVHPKLSTDGTWHTTLALTPGDWRVFADFTPAGQGEAMTLGADVAVPGEYEPQPLPHPTTPTEVDGYTVTLDDGLVPGAGSELTLTVTRDGRPVTDLEPYLAAYGHLVALREGDLAYLHVHPAGEPGDGMTEPGPDIAFHATAPSPGAYRLFLDFKHEGVVRTAEFTVVAGDAGAQSGHGEH